MWPVTRFVWHLVERYTLRRHKYLTIETPNGLVCVVLTAYRGESIELRGGTRLTTDDIILELHFDNSTLIALLARHGTNGNSIIRAGLEDLRAIARHLRENNVSYHAVHCRTILYDILIKVRAYIPEHPRTIHDRLEQLFQEMAIITFRKEKGLFQYLCSHHHPISVAWYTAEEFAFFEWTRAREKSP